MNPTAFPISLELESEAEASATVTGFMVNTGYELFLVLNPDKSSKHEEVKRVVSDKVAINHSVETIGKPSSSSIDDISYELSELYEHTHAELQLICEQAAKIGPRPTYVTMAGVSPEQIHNDWRQRDDIEIVVIRRGTEMKASLVWQKPSERFERDLMEYWRKLRAGEFKEYH